MKYTFYLNNWNFFPHHPIFWCNVKRNFLRNRISRVDCYFLSISPFFSVKDRWNEVFREELLLLLLFLFPFSDLHGIQYFFPIGGILDHLFIIRLSQRQIKMIFKFHSIMAMTSSIFPPVYIVGHYYTVLSLWIFTNIRVFGIFSLSWIFKRRDFVPFSQNSFQKFREKESNEKIPMFIHEVLYDLFSLIPIILTILY